MNQHQADVEVQQSFPQFEVMDNAHGVYEQFNTKGAVNHDGEEDGIDLEGYEEYLQHLKSKIAVRPCSARIVLPMPTESSSFSMINPDVPVPVRPVSARPRMCSTPRNPSTMNSSQCHSNSWGVRRKRRGEKLVNARIRAVYNNDAGRSSLQVKQNAPVNSAASLNSKSNVFQNAEMHDEYYRLLDAETELKAICLQEQQKRVKAIATVRRLEEIIAAKDRKIESLLHAKVIGVDRSLSTNKSVAQREMAERDRQIHAREQKLKQKISEQSQLLSSYEEAMQSLRSGTKYTNLMELEEERNQLYQELSHHQALLDRQCHEWDSQQQKLLIFAETEASNNFYISKLQHEHKIILYEKRKLEQQVEFLKSRVELLQNNLALEQRKRTYDRDFSDSVDKHNLSSSTQKTILVQALEEMKKRIHRDSVSIRREKLKSPKSATTPPRPDQHNSLIPTTPSAKASALKASNKVSLLSPRLSRPSTWSNITAHQTPNQSDIRHSFKVDAVSAAIGTASAADPSSPLTSDKKLDMQVQFVECDDALNIAVQGDDGNLESHADQKIDEALNDAMTYRDDVGTDKQNQNTHSCLETDLCRVQYSGGAQLTQAQDENQITDERMAAMQQQTLAAAESMLRLDVDDEYDSESSGDILDDAQHPMLCVADTHSNDVSVGCINDK